MVTFARFTALHVLLLPPVTAFLLIVAPHFPRPPARRDAAPGDEDLPAKKKFYPQQVFKDTVAIFVGFAFG